MDRYKYLYRDGDTLFFEHRGTERSAFLDELSPREFEVLTEAFGRNIPAPLLEAAVTFTELRLDKTGNTRVPKAFKEVYSAGDAGGFARGFAAAERTFSGRKHVKPTGSGRACATCGTYQESRKCVTCGAPTWRMSLTEAWFYGMAKLSESAKVEFDGSRATVTDGDSKSLIVVPSEEAASVASVRGMTESGKLRFARSRGKLVESRWSRGFGCFSRGGSRVDPVEMLTETVRVDSDDKGMKVKFVESGRTASVAKADAEKMAAVMSSTGMRASSVAGYLRASRAGALKETSTMANITSPVGKLAGARHARLMNDLVRGIGIVEYDPKKGFAAMVVPRTAVQSRTALKEARIFTEEDIEKRGLVPSEQLFVGEQSPDVPSVEDTGDLDFKDPDYEDFAELGVAAGDPDPTVKAGADVVFVIVPLVLCGTEDGVDLTSEEERLLDHASDGEEHFPVPSDNVKNPFDTERALDSLEARGFVERSRGRVSYRLTESGRRFAGRGD